MSTSALPRVNQRGIIHLLPLLFVVVLSVTVGLLLIYKGAVKNPVPNLIKIASPGQVDLAADYQNPLDKSSQYVNPFAGYKNPFETLK